MIKTSGKVRYRPFVFRLKANVISDYFDVRVGLDRLGRTAFSPCYLPAVERLTVTVIKGRNLKPMDISGTSGGYSADIIQNIYSYWVEFHIRTYIFDIHRGQF